MLTTEFRWTLKKVVGYFKIDSAEISFSNIAGGKMNCGKEKEKREGEKNP